MSRTTNDHRKTMPWSDDEFIRVRGGKYVYSTNNVGHVTAVHLPGGGIVTVDELLASGYRVLMPRQKRMDRFV